MAFLMPPELSVLMHGYPGISSSSEMMGIPLKCDKNALISFSDKKDDIAPVEMISASRHSGCA